MYTLIETPLFETDARTLWSEDERGKFFAFLSENPEAGSVVPGSGGCRKIRWMRRGMGKIRVIYYNRLANGEIWLLVIYAKAVRGDIPAVILKAIRESIEYA